MTSGTNMAFGEALLTAITGYAIVFLGILLLVGVVLLVSRLMTAQDRAHAAAPAPAPEHPAQAKQAPGHVVAPVAPGTAGELKLYDTDPRTAAMIMAIVADEMKTPLNELRFKSIREVKKS